VNSKWEDEPTIPKLTVEYREAIDIFPALHKYKTEHSKENLQKLCVEVSQFCRAIYSSTRNNEERQVYFNMLDKLKK
jgi:hypothetical protein